MPKLLQRPWTCLSCLWKQQTGRRLYASAAVAASVRDANQSYLHNPRIPETSHDDRTIRQIFDSPRFWHDFSKSKSASISLQNAGLFQNHYLRNPEGLHEFARVTLEKCRRIVTKVLEVNTVDGYRDLAKDFDRLGDLLCRIIDLSDFVRSTHPDPGFQNAASEVHALMFEYMNTLNTTTGLNDQLGVALGIPEVVGSWTEEEKMAAHILRKDFSQSAIYMPQERRRRFVELSSMISQLGSRFIEEMEPARSYFTFDGNRLKGMDPTTLGQIPTRRGHKILPAVGVAANHAIKYAEDEAVRRDVYLANRTASPKQIRVLEELLHYRAEIAKLSDYPNYASMVLVGKMADRPSAVHKFLSALADANTPNMRNEHDQLLALKRSLPYRGRSPDVLNAWDRDFYRNRIPSGSTKTRASRKPDFLQAFFSLGTVMQGLSRLFTRLYGIRFVPREPLPGETWDPDVRRLDVVDDSGSRIAVIYCDLFARPGKSPNPAHYTLRCSRLISPSELSESLSDSQPADLSPHQLANDSMAVSAPTADGSVYQLPTIALICDFPPPSTSAFSTSPPSLLTLNSVTTLFHEMGHAMHSVLGRTKLQTVAGTRCATDFAELPSVLMEHFATDPTVLGLFARHWETDAPLPYEMVQDQLTAQRRTEAADTESQVLLAMADQAFHSVGPEEQVDSARLWHGVQKHWASVPEPEETRWQGFFGHVVGYGGCYYAYLFDRAIARRVWDVVFEGGKESVGRESGERFKEEVLRWGGSRSAWSCVAGVLREDELEGGGEKAMETVGRWGVGG